MWKPITVFTLLVVLVIGALCFMPSLRYLQWLSSGKSQSAFIRDQFGPPIMLEVGVLIDGNFVGGDIPIRVTSGTELQLAYRVSNILHSQVSEIEFWLDNVKIPPNESIRIIEARREPYILRAQGRSSDHDATFRGQCFITVLESPN